MQNCMQYGSTRDGGANATFKGGCKIWNRQNRDNGELNQVECGMKGDGGEGGKGDEVQKGCG